MKKIFLFFLVGLMSASAMVEAVPPGTYFIVPGEVGTTTIELPFREWTVIQIQTLENGVWRSDLPFVVRVEGGEADLQYREGKISVFPLTQPFIRLEVFSLQPPPPPPPPDLERVYGYPNPARKPPLIFANLPEGRKAIKIFNIAGELVKELETYESQVEWDLKNEAGNNVASGIYIYLIIDDAGHKKLGKLGIIR